MCTNIAYIELILELHRPIYKARASYDCLRDYGMLVIKVV